MADQQMEALTELTTKVANLGFLVNDTDDTTDDGGGSPKYILDKTLGGLTQKTETADANITGLVGRLHIVTMNDGSTPWTADRQFTLPTTFAVGQRCGAYIVDGDAAFEMPIRTGAGGDLIDNVDYSAANWSKLFLPGELVIFEGIVANTAWACILDRRIRCREKAEVTTSVTTSTASADTLIPFDIAVSGYGRGGLLDTTNKRFVARRAAKWRALLICGPANAITVDHYYSPRIYKNGTGGTLIGNTIFRESLSASTFTRPTFGETIMADGDYVDGWFNGQTTNAGVTNAATSTWMSVEESF